MFQVSCRLDGRRKINFRGWGQQLLRKISLTLALARSVALPPRLLT